MKAKIYLFMILFAETSIAAESNLMVCTDLGFFWGDCKLTAATLSAETRTSRRFSIQYSFLCPGHDINIGFETNNGFGKLRSSEKPQTLVLEGQSLRITDQDSAKTLKSTFDVNCKLEIKDIKIALSEDASILLDMIKTESSIISESMSGFLALADSLRESQDLHDTINLESVLFQRDQLRKISEKIGMMNLPASSRISVAANLRMIDEMVSETKSEEFLSIRAKCKEIFHVMLESIRLQETALLDRISELKLRATEMLVDTGEQDDPQALELFAQLDRCRGLFNSHL